MAAAIYRDNDRKYKGSRMNDLTGLTLLWQCMCGYKAGADPERYFKHQDSGRCTYWPKYRHRVTPAPAPTGASLSGFNDRRCFMWATALISPCA